MNVIVLSHLAEALEELEEARCNIANGNSKEALAISEAEKVVVEAIATYVCENSVIKR